MPTHRVVARNVITHAVREHQPPPHGARFRRAAGVYCLARHVRQRFRAAFAPAACVR